MCARFNVDGEAIEEMISKADTRNPALRELPQGDIRPSEPSPIIAGHRDMIHAGIMRWGLPRYDGKGLIINTRSETALEKQMFHENIRYRRCAIPAKVFYEWDHQKHLTTFSLPDQSIIWMAGIYDKEYRFSVLTTAANESVTKIHDRMPLILAREDLRQWLFDFDAVQELLDKKMPTLNHRQDDEQMSLF